MTQRGLPFGLRLEIPGGHASWCDAHGTRHWVTYGPSCVDFSWRVFQRQATA